MPLISPQKAVESGWIKRATPITGEMIQPNGIDFTLDKLFEQRDDVFVLSPGEFKTHHKYVQKEFYNYTSEHTYEFPAYLLNPKTSYDFLSDFEVKVPIGVAALVIARSTLNRNSIFITTGLYDSGFQGLIGGQLHNLGGRAVLGLGSRIGQIVFIDAQAARAYEGQYNKLQAHWSEQGVPEKEFGV